MDKFRLQNILLLISFTMLVGGTVGAVLYYGFPEYFPKWYGYILVFFFSLETGMISAIDKGRKLADAKKLVNLYLGIRVAKLLMALTFITIYALVIKENIKSFVLVFMIIYFFYIFFDTFYISRVEKRLKKDKNA